MDPSVGSRGPLFDDKLDHISFQKLFWSINHLVKVSHKNWSTFLLQKTRAAQGTEVPREMVLPERQMGNMISRRPLNRCTGSFSFGLVQFNDQRLLCGLSKVE